MFKATHPLTIRSVLLRQNLECDLPFEAEIFGEVNLTHPACTQKRDDLMVTKSLSYH